MQLGHRQGAAYLRPRGRRWLAIGEQKPDFATRIAHKLKGAGSAEGRSVPPHHWTGGWHDSDRRRGLEQATGTRRIDEEAVIQRAQTPEPARRYSRDGGACDADCGYG